MRFRSGRLLMRLLFVRRMRSVLKSIRVQRLGNLSVYHIWNRLVENFRKHEILERSNAVAYNLILAIFPAVIFLFTLIPYISLLFPELNQESIMGFLATMMPKNMYETISATVLDIVSNQRGGLLTFGFGAALYLATNGMNALIHAFNSCYKTTELRSAWRVRLTATALTLLLAVVLLVTVVMVIAGQILLDYIGANLRQFSHLQLDEFTLLMIQVMRLAVVFTGFFLAISCIYYFGPSVHYNWSFFLSAPLLQHLDR